MQALLFKNHYFNFNPVVQKKVSNQASKMVPAMKTKLQNSFSSKVYNMRMQNQGLGLSYNELSLAFKNICKDIGVDPKDYLDIYLKCIK